MNLEPTKLNRGDNQPDSTIEKQLSQTSYLRNLTQGMANLLGTTNIQNTQNINNSEVSKMENKPI